MFRAKARRHNFMMQANRRYCYYSFIYLFDSGSMAHKTQEHMNTYTKHRNAKLKKKEKRK